MRPEWVLAVRDRCLAAGVAFTFKQWGAWGPDGVRRDKKANGRLPAPGKEIGKLLVPVNRTQRIGNP